MRLARTGGPWARGHSTCGTGLTPVLTWASENQVPILVGEAGVPCTEAWTAVLDFVFRHYLEPAGISMALWHYVDPAHCPSAVSPINLLACPERHVLNVLARYSGRAELRGRAFALYYSSTEGMAVGSLFKLTIPAGYTGNLSATQSITVTVANSLGNSTKTVSF